MLKPDLTIQGAIEVLGEPTRLVSWEIAPDDEIIQVYKNFRESLNNLFREGIVYCNMLGLGLTNSANKNPEAVKRWQNLNALQDRFNEIFSKNTSFMESPCVLTLTLQEALTNAIEHGVKFGKNGGIEIRAVISERGEIWVIDQPTAGVSLEELKAKHDSGERINRDAGFGEVRGCGFARFCSWILSPTESVWYENLENGGYRLILFDITEATRRALLTEEERRAEDSKRYSDILISSLADCDCKNNDPEAFYSAYFPRRYRISLEYVLSIVSDAARELYEDNCRGYAEKLAEAGY